ncbi:hypothetical protein AB0L75_27855 [Streptomyces sp. NPDC052101]|uniref:hypothetical protein n=1 Tax=Streptomyces sp. NPDC052101 TaxID=3155763 RepID=UPI00343D3F5B
MPKSRLTFGYGSCRTCLGWGDLRFDDVCWPCALWTRKIRDPHHGACRRCARTSTLTYESICRPCTVEIHYADGDWVRAQRNGAAVPVRPLQLALLLPEVKFAVLQPLHKRNSTPKLNMMPRTRDWKTVHLPPERTDDLRVCTPQIHGQLALLTMARTFRPADGRRIWAREIAEGHLLDLTVRRLQKELGHGQQWRYTLMPEARLILAAREADEDLVREEDIDRLPYQQGPVTLVLREAGLLRPRSEPKPPVLRRRMVGPRRLRSDAKQPRPLAKRPPRILLSCEQCLAWTGNARRPCDLCRAWALTPGRAVGTCSRCTRQLPLHEGRCRSCCLAVAAGSPPDRVMDQLWLGASGYRPPRPRPPEPETPTAPPVPLHLAIPGQEPLFETPVRDWTRLLGNPLHELTASARDLLDVLDRKARAESWDIQIRRANLRVLRAAVAYLGAKEPIPEVDIRAIAKLGTNYAGLRVAHFLEARGLLIPRPDRDIGMDQAAVTRLIATAPAGYQGDLDAWVRVLRGQGRRRSVPIEWVSVRRYVGYVLPVLAEWESRFATLAEVDKDDVVKALKARPGPQGFSLFSGLRSLFGALKRERRIFHDPARNVHLGSRPPVVPRPIPDTRLVGILDKARTPFGKLVVALVAIHAVRPMQLPKLMLSGLDRSRGQLKVGLRTVYLDELTLRLARDWLADRHRQWPCSTNPHLLVSRRTAMHSLNPPVSKLTINYVFRSTGLNPSTVAVDRVLDEADHSEDPLHLMKVFDLSVTTAIKYVQAAHPELCVIDPIRA